MRIWYINNYNMLPEHGHLNRGYYLGKYLKKLGHEPVVFVGSHPHNTKLQLIEDNAPYKVYQKKPFPWVLIKTRNYEGSKKSRVISMLEFYFNMKKAAKHFKMPDAIIGSSAHPLAALLAIQLGKKYGCKSIVEVRDLWPESIVAYGLAKENNPLIIMMRKMEKWLYTKADNIVFLMAGGYDYIKNQGWGDVISDGKVEYVSNGIDLELFDRNAEEYQIRDDTDLENESAFKIVYTGSLRKADEQILGLFDAISQMQGVEFADYVFLIYGDGNLREELEERCKKNGYKNVRIKGFVDKRYIPNILSKCNLAILNIYPNDVLKYGGSQNKLFDYLAAGLPIISGENNKYSIVNRNACGVSKKFSNAKDLVETIGYLKSNPIEKAHIRKVAEQYDYKILAQKVADISSKK